MAGDGPLPKPHGHSNPAQGVSRTLGKAGFGQQLIRKGVGYGGFQCRWDKHLKATSVTYHTSDTTYVCTSEIEQKNEVRDMIRQYTEALKAVGYNPVVNADDTHLTVEPKTPQKKRTISVMGDRGTPVHHEVTGRLVGYLRDGKFIEVE